MISRRMSDFAGTIRTRFNSMPAETTTDDNDDFLPAPPSLPRRGRATSDYIDTVAVQRYSKDMNARPFNGGSGRARADSAPRRVARSLSSLVGAPFTMRRRDSSIHAVDLSVLESTQIALDPDNESAADDEISFKSCHSHRGESVDRADDDDEPEACLICMQKFTKKRVPIKIPCVKQCNLTPVHAKCIYEWKEQKKGSGTCPLCRSALGAIDYTPPDVLKLSTLSLFNARKNFCCKPIPPPGGVIRCYLRVKNGMFGSPAYFECWMQAPTTVRYPVGPLPDASFPEAGDRLLMIGRKKYNRWGNSYVEITMDEPSQGKPNCLGTVHSNMSGLEHTVVVPTTSLQGSNGSQEIATIHYTQNRIGSGSGPRQMSILLPNITPVDSRCEDSASTRATEDTATSVSDVKMEFDIDLDSDDDEEDDDDEPTSYVTNAHFANGKDNTLAAILKQGKDKFGKKFIGAKNKEPYWLDSIQAYSLDFQGRVTLPSNKNFQLECDTNPMAISLQFGKVVSNEEAPVAMYTMDVQWPLSPLQAFGICVSSCDRKLACA